MAAAALKAIVVILGLMILAGLTLMGAILAGRFAHRDAPPRPDVPAAATASAYTGPAIELPAGAQVDRMTIGGDRLVLDIALPAGGRELVILDLATGRQIGTIPLHRAPSPAAR